MKSLLLAIIRCAGRIWCRMHGAEVSSTALIHGFPRIVIRNGGKIIIGPGVTINAAIWSNPFNDGRCTVLFTHPGGIIHLKENVGISSSRIIATQSVAVGPDSLIGPSCSICDSDRHPLPIGTESSIRSAPINIGAKVFIGTGSVILKGVEIGDESVIGAGSVVTRDIPARSIAAGNPAKITRHF